MRMKFAWFLLILLFPTLAGAQVAEQWLARYHGPGPLKRTTADPGSCYASSEPFEIRALAPSEASYTDARAGINSSTQIAGNYVGDGYTSYLWTDGTFTTLGKGIAYGLNDSGQVVGMSNSTNRATLWTADSEIDLGTLTTGGSSVALGINNAGVVVGSDSDPTGRITHAFQWTPNGGMQYLPSLGGNYAEAVAINDLGQAVGWAAPADTSIYSHAVMWANGTIADLGTYPGDSQSIAYKSNTAGQIVGQSTRRDEFGTNRAFLWQDGSFVDLGAVPGFNNSIAVDINAAGQVVGYSWTRPVVTHRAWAYLDGTLRDLNDLIPLSSREHWILQVADGINDKGEIVGNGLLDGNNSAYLLIPEQPLNRGLGCQ